MNQDNERFVAFEGVVQLTKWMDSSATGFRAYFALGSREELDYFDKLTKRTKRRAGTRFRCVVTELGPNGAHLATVETQFMGANWSHQGGASITLHFNNDDAEWWKMQRTSDASTEVEGEVYRFILIELDDEDQPIDQRQRDRVETVAKMLPGPHCNHVVRLCRDAEFLAYLKSRYEMEETPTQEQAKSEVLRACGIQSRKELDYDEEAWERFQNKLERPFIRWRTKGGRVLA